MLLIDSSAIVRFFSREPGWDQITDYISQSLTLSFALVEFGNALLKKVAKKELKREYAVELIERYSSRAILINQNEYLGAALEIAAENGLVMYDSIFIAAALTEGHELVSCDERQISVAKSLGVKTIEC